MNCEWCGKNPAEFQMVIYYLKEETNVANTEKRNIKQYTRNGQYLQVKLCEKCLPCTTTNNLMGYKLRGEEPKKKNV